MASDEMQVSPKPEGSIVAKSDCRLMAQVGLDRAQASTWVELSCVKLIEVLEKQFWGWCLALGVVGPVGTGDASPVVGHGNATSRGGYAAGVIRKQRIRMQP